MISQVKLKAVYINTQDKDGKTLVDKNGNAYSRVVIESENGHKASMFCGKYGLKDLEKIKTWKTGDTVNVILEQSGTYINFTVPSKLDELIERVEKLENAVFLTTPVRNDITAIKTPQNAEFDPTERVDDTTDIPF